MGKTSTRRIKFRRHLEGRTNYVKRLAYIKGGKCRAVIRKSTNHIQVQFITTKNGMDFVLAAGHTKELHKFNYHGHTGNIPAAYLAGFLAGKRFLLTKNIEALADLGVQRSVLGTRIFAVIKGIKDAGVKIAVEEKALPKEERIYGKHVEDYFQHASAPKNKTQFATYATKNIMTKGFSVMVEQSKNSINEKVKA